MTLILKCDLSPIMLDENLDENLFYKITLPLDIPSRGYWLENGQRLVTFDFDPYNFMRVFKFDYHWTFLAEIMAGNVIFRQNFSDLWPWANLSEISASTPHVVSLGQGGISSSVLSVFFTDNCYKLLKSLHLIGWEQICQWKTLTKCLMKCPPGVFLKSH